MNTKYALHARFGTPIVALADICEEFFHVNAETANGKANSNSLPIPVFRMEEHKRSPFMVHVDDLADLIDLRIQAAKHEFSMQGKLTAEEMRIVQRWQLLSLCARLDKGDRQEIRRIEKARGPLPEEVSKELLPYFQRIKA